jgi:hypothetical protein
MRKLPNLILGLAVIITFVVLPVASASAAGGFDPFKAACSNTSDGAICTNTNGKNGIDGNPLAGPNGLIGKVTKDVALFAAIAAVIIIIIAGFIYVTSQGDAGKVAQAKNTIIYAAVGLVVIGVSQSIIVFVINRL